MMRQICRPVCVCVCVCVCAIVFFNDKLLHFIVVAPLLNIALSKISIYSSYIKSAYLKKLNNKVRLQTTLLQAKLTALITAFAVSNSTKMGKIQLRN